MTKSNNSNDNQFDNIVEDAQTECMVKLEGTELKTFELYEAIANNDLEAAEKAILEGANINAQNQPCWEEDNDTPLDSAAMWSSSYDCSLDMIKLLRKFGATNYDLEKVKYLDKADECGVSEFIQKKH
ncbi:MAG: hypothetical protein P4L22_00020 [Candidatus Babeliales bacterium]|nr:hypothetical protein [Candidatus Babeliales bacterium]